MASFYCYHNVKVYKGTLYLFAIGNTFYIRSQIKEIHACKAE